MSDANCPYCGEPEETDTPSCITIYRCGTRIYPNGSSETPLICDLGRDLRREREAHNKTKRERDELLKEHSTLREIAEGAIMCASLWAGSRSSTPRKLREQLNQLNQIK